MVVLAAAVTSRNGKLLVSRQFVEMTRMRVEGLITAFPKLLGGAGAQHTFVETGNVRYLYHPLEDLYLILITSKQSNIVEDLETLKLMSRLWVEYCPELHEGEEDRQIENTFEFVNALDELISNGYREQVTVAQVRTNMEMSSSEYQMHKELEEAKKAEARANMERRVEEMDAKRATERKFGNGGLGNTGFGSTAQGGQIGSMSDVGGSGIISKPAEYGETFYDSAPVNESKVKKPSMKMSIKSKAQKGSMLLDQLEKDGEIMGDPTAVVDPVAKQAGNAAELEAINLTVEESANISYDEDGNFNNMQIQGRIFLQISDKEQAKCKIHIAHSATSDFQFNTHPNIKKEAFFGVSDPWLRLAKEDRAFPCGNALGILKWRYQTSDDSKSPVSVTCWPSNQAGKTHCNLEYQLGEVLAELEDFIVRVPIPGSSAHAPEIVDCDGEATFDSKNAELLWRVPSMDQSNGSGALEFAVPTANHAEFFPVNVGFTSPSTMCSMEVLEVLGENDAPKRFSKQIAFKV